MQGRKWVTKGFVFGMVLVVAALSQLGTSGAAPATKVIELSFSHHEPAESWFNKLFMDFATEIEKRTNGQVKITVYPGAALLKPNQVYEGIIKGVADIGTSTCSYTPGRFPLTEVIDLPIGTRSSWQGSHIAWEIYKKFQPTEFEEAKLLYLWTSPSSHINTKKPVNKLEDMKGLKIRCAPGARPMMDALGAVPIGIPISDTYTGLERGTFDGTLGPYQVLKSFRLAEVIKYTTEAYFYAGYWFVSMNRDKWNSLSPELKKIFEEVSEKFVDISGRRNDEADLVGKALSLSLGNKVITLPSEELARWDEHFRPILDKWVAEKEAKGFPARAALNEVFSLQKKYK